MQHRQPDASIPPPLLAAIKAVLRWESPARGSKGQPNRTGLSAEAKLAWLSLILDAGGINRSWVTHAAALAAAIGAQDARSGRYALDKLEEEGLIERNRYKGDVSVYFKDPQEVAIARRTRAASDSGQGDLFPEAPNSPSEGTGAPAEVTTLPLGTALPPVDNRGPGEPEASTDASMSEAPAPADEGQAACDAQHKPACDAHHKPPQHRTSSARAHNTSNIKHLIPNEDVKCAPGLSCASQAADRAEIERLEIDADDDRRRDLQRLANENRPDDAPGHAVPLGHAIREGLARIERAAVDPLGKLGQDQKWLAYLRDRLPDIGKFRDGKTSLSGHQLAGYLAAKLADGKFPRDRLNDAFTSLNWHCRNKPIANRTGYFFGIIRVMFCDLEIPWPGNRKPKFERTNP